MQTVAATFEFRNTVLFPTETGARNKQLPMIWPPTCCEMMEMVPQAAACSQASANQEDPCCPPSLLVAEASSTATLMLGCPSQTSSPTPSSSICSLLSANLHERTSLKKLPKKRRKKGNKKWRQVRDRGERKKGQGRKGREGKEGRKGRKEGRKERVCGAERRGPPVWMDGSIDGQRRESEIERREGTEGSRQNQKRERNERVTWTSVVGVCF